MEKPASASNACRGGRPGRSRERNAAAERPPDDSDSAPVDARRCTKLRGSVPDDPDPGPENVAGAAGAIAETPCAGRRSQPEVVDVQRGDAVLRQLDRKSVIERREPAAAVEDDDRAPTGRRRPAELRSNGRTPGREVVSGTTGAEMREPLGSRSCRPSERQHRHGERDEPHIVESSSGCHADSMPLSGWKPFRRRHPIRGFFGEPRRRASTGSGARGRPSIDSSVARLPTIGRGLSRPCSSVDAPFQPAMGRASGAPTRPRPRRPLSTTTLPSYAARSGRM